jgi:actin-like ATPase involved in cell morphogenesis
MLTKNIGVDLGTVNVLVWVKGKGIILQEPSVVAIALNDNKIVAVGNDARAMLGRTPETIEVARPSACQSGSRTSRAAQSTMPPSRPEGGKPT